MTRGLVVAIAVIAAVACALVGFGAWASARLTGGFGDAVAEHRDVDDPG